MVLEHLQRRYNSPQPGGHIMSMLDLNLPNTLEELHQRYRLKFFHTGLRNHRPIVEVTNREEIRSAAIFNIVHSSLCTSEDKTSFSFHLLNAYSQYSDSQIRATLNVMKKDKTIAQHKRRLR